jgi:hypothetical protein
MMLEYGDSNPRQLRAIFGGYSDEPPLGNVQIYNLWHKKSHNTSLKKISFLKYKDKMVKRTNGDAVSNGNKKRKTEKKKILLNAFDMSTVGHLSPGQWKVS